LRGDWRAALVAFDRRPVNAVLAELEVPRKRDLGFWSSLAGARCTTFEKEFVGIGDVTPICCVY
jgi:hypothetical protein